MVTVDMSPARDKISKRKRRMRRAGRVRMQRARRAHIKELQSLEKARRAREQSKQRWADEEERLRRQRARKNNGDDTPMKKKPSVRFAGQVMVTEIPLAADQSLPKPLSSPIGVPLSEKDSDDDGDDVEDFPSSTPIPFALLTEDTFADDDDSDPEFTPDHDLLIDTAAMKIKRPRRRIVAKRLSDSFDDPQAQSRAKILQSDNLDKRKRIKNGTANFEPPTASAALDSSSSPQSPSNPKTSPTKNNDSNTQPVLDPDVGTGRKSRKKRKRMHDNALTKTEPSAKTQRVRPAKEALTDAKTNGHSVQHKEGSTETTSSDRPENGLDRRRKGTDNDGDLDDMFGDMVKQRAVNKAAKERRIKSARAATEKTGSPRKSKDKYKQGPTGPARYTEDGLRIVSYDELAADQPSGLKGECPFDCSCCF